MAQVQGHHQRAARFEQNRTPGQADFAHEIGKAAQRGSHLTRQLLLCSQRQPPKMSDFDLTEIVAQVMKTLQRLLGEDARMQVNCAPRPLAVHAENAMTARDSSIWRSRVWVAMVVTNLDGARRWHGDQPQRVKNGKSPG